MADEAKIEVDRGEALDDLRGALARVESLRQMCEGGPAVYSASISHLAWHDAWEYVDEAFTRLLYAGDKLGFTRDELTEPLL